MTSRAAVVNRCRRPVARGATNDTAPPPYLRGPNSAILFAQRPPARPMTHAPALHLVQEIVVEHHGVFGTIWASLGMTAYYMALTWINILLGLMLGPLFMIPLTWAQDAFAKK